jgi:DNA-binding transcriptional MerR regulator
MREPEYVTISAFARMCGVSAKTLRFYDEIRLFRPAFTDPRTRYRFYLQIQMRDFARIQAMRDGGATLAEIRAALRVPRSKREQMRFLQRLRDARLETIDEARRSLAWLEGALMDIEMQSPLYATIRYFAPMQIASIRTAITTYAGVLQYEKQLWQAVEHRCRGRLRGVLWHRCASAGVLEAEPFVEVKVGTATCSAYVVKELPGAHVLRAFTSLDDHEAEDTYQGLNRWIRARDYRLAGAKREIYRDELLEIQYPLQTAPR